MIAAEWIEQLAVFAAHGHLPTLYHPDGRIVIDLEVLRDWRADEDEAEINHHLVICRYCGWNHCVSHQRQCYGRLPLCPRPRPRLR